MKILLNEKYCRRKVVQGRREVDVFRREIYPQINVTLCAVLGVPIMIYQKYSIPANNLLGHLSTIMYNLIW